MCVTYSWNGPQRVEATKISFLVSIVSDAHLHLTKMCERYHT